MKFYSDDGENFPLNMPQGVHWHPPMQLDACQESGGIIPSILLAGVVPGSLPLMRRRRAGKHEGGYIMKPLSTTIPNVVHQPEVRP